MYADDRVIFFSAPLISQIDLQLNLKLINLLSGCLQIK